MRWCWGHCLQSQITFISCLLQFANGSVYIDTSARSRLLEPHCHSVTCALWPDLKQAHCWQCQSGLGLGQWIMLDSRYLEWVAQPTWTIQNHSDTNEIEKKNYYMHNGCLLEFPAAFEGSFFFNDICNGCLATLLLRTVRSRSKILTRVRIERGSKALWFHNGETNMAQ